MTHIFSDIFSVVGLILILTFFCGLFTNAVENFGKVFAVNDNALGNILAAVGTALPETALPLVAILGAYVTGNEVKIGCDICKGSVLGSMFFLSTIEFFIIAITVKLAFLLKKRKNSEIVVNTDLFKKNLMFFLTAYGIGITALFASNFVIMKLCGIFLPCFYIFFALKTLSAENNCMQNENKIHKPPVFEKLFRKILPVKPIIFLQIFFSLAGIVLSTHLFAGKVAHIATDLGVSALITAMFIAPFATELPETVNAAIWSFKSEDELAVGNITGALMFQSCFPLSVALLFTDGLHSNAACVNVFSVLLAVSVLLFFVKNRQCSTNPLIFVPLGFFYAFYFLFLLVTGTN